MRQVGVLCAAAEVGVRYTLGKLADDHRKAKVLAGFILIYVLHPIYRPLVASI
jgi:hypothetical protein